MSYVDWFAGFYVLVAIVIGLKGLRFAWQAFREGQYGASGFLFIFTMVFVVSGAVCLWRLILAWGNPQLIPFTMPGVSGS